jgi:hypothetical protein
MASAAAQAADPDVEDAWAQIVARYDVEAPGRSWPEAEDLPEPLAGPRRVLPPRIVTPQPSVDPPEEEPSLLDALDTFGADLPDEEDHFTPPTAPPLPRPSLPTALAILGIICGLVLFLEPNLLPVSESVAMLTGFSAVMGGFATLVWRLRPGDDEEDEDPDNGARV